MTNFNFTLGVPNPPDDPSDNVADMQENNDNIAAIIDVDHVGFQQTNGGYHRIVHQPIFPIGGETDWVAAAGPVRTAIEATKIAGVNQVFALNYTPPFVGATTDTQLFSMTGQGGISQLTGSNAIANGGWCWFGGILAIWGFNPLPVSPINPVVFTAVSPTTIPFPNACFQVFTTIQGTTFATATADIIITAVTPTQFSWVQTGGSRTNMTGFSWLAIGN